MDNSFRANELPGLLAAVPDHIAVLSLDCFDTLIWRNVHMPSDVFADLDLPGGAVEARSVAEERARTLALLRGEGGTEVTLAEIYEQMMPGDHRAEARDALLAAELAAEARHCFAFAPVRDLIVDAKRRGLKVIVVSDTYLREPQLRALIRSAGGDSLADMIDRIFCSCEYGVSKAGGLFTHVLAALGVPPRSILHIGDNQVADHQAPLKLGIAGLHFRQFDEEAMRRLRFEAAAAMLVDPQTRITHATYQPQRAALALRGADDPVSAFGHDVLGPVIHAFADWIRGEALAMEARLGKPVKLLFLLRDGHFPGQVFRAAHPDLAGRAIDIELSRFAATAAGLKDADAIRSYAETALMRAPLDVVARQLLFDGDEAAKLRRIGDRREVLKEVLRPQIVRRIVSRSAAFAERLLAYLRGQGIADGDAVMLIDLGYNGSVQNGAEPILRERMGLDVAGRYLLLREMQLSGLDKSGFLDTRHYGKRLLYALADYIALLEQFCTLAQGSVIDYRRDGTPIRRKSSVKREQSDCRDAAQAAALAFVRSAAAGWVRPPASDGPDARRHMAAAALARFLYLPLASEVAMLRNFHHDVNLSTDDTLEVMNFAAAGRGLRRRGLFYGAAAKGLYLPGEIQPQGLSLNLALMSARCLSLNLSKSDLDAGAFKLPVWLGQDGARHALEVDAVPTVDGYFHALVPIGPARFSAGIRVGAFAEWLQVEEACFQPVEDAMSGADKGVPAAAAPESLTQAAPGLFHAPDAAGTLVYEPPKARTGANMVLSLVFRPVVRRAAADDIARREAA